MPAFANGLLGAEMILVNPFTPEMEIVGATGLWSIGSLTLDFNKELGSGIAVDN